MTTQNYKNHTRLVPLWHFVGGFLLLALLGGSIVNFIHADAHTHYSAALILVIALILTIYFGYIRSFALKAQDRVIRAEENFRHYLLTGKQLDRNLRLRQIISLRFASDEEFPALAQKAASEELTPKQIKLLIKNWRPDYNRV